jgi:Helix-turn-helix.
MKEINIAGTIVKKRHEKGLTQEELANYLGVSKASVSKWETGQSYPDITFLPQLATFFNISIDELIGYEPQMSKEDIRKLYVRLSADFASRPFDEVLDACREIYKNISHAFLFYSISAYCWLTTVRKQETMKRPFPFYRKQGNCLLG